MLWAFRTKMGSERMGAEPWYNPLGVRFPKFTQLPKERMPTDITAMSPAETRAWAAKQLPIEGAWLKDGKGAVEGFPRWHLASAYYPKIGPNGSAAGNVRAREESPRCTALWSDADEGCDIYGMGGVWRMRVWCTTPCRLTASAWQNPMSRRGAVVY